MEEKEITESLNKQLDGEPEPKAPILSNRYDYAEGKCGYVIPDGYEFDSIKEGFKKEIIIRPIRPTYPKNFDECCTILGYDIDREISFDTQTCKTDTLFENFYKLYVCRDVYWKVYGIQNNLNQLWKPDWTQRTTKYCIWNCKNKVEKFESTFANFVLSFPTSELRDTFLENFRELIEECKGLI